MYYIVTYCRYGNTAATAEDFLTKKHTKNIQSKVKYILRLFVRYGIV